MDKLIVDCLVYRYLLWRLSGHLNCDEDLGRSVMAPQDERFELALSNFSDTFALLRSDIDSLRGIVPDSCLVELHKRVRVAYSQFLLMQYELDNYLDYLKRG